MKPSSSYHIDKIAAPSGRGTAIPTITPRVKFGLPPSKIPFRVGSVGDPSTTPDVFASMLLQKTMNDDDIEYFKDIHDDPPYDVLRTYIREFVSNENLREFSSLAGGAISGYTMPLGTSNYRRNRAKFLRKMARIYAGAELVD